MCASRYPLQEGKGDKLIGVISPVVAMLNHSCDGNALVNAMWDASKSAVVVRVSTLRDVKAGEYHDICIIIFTLLGGACCNLL